MGEEGFSSDSALLYHREIPSAIVDAPPGILADLATTPNEPLSRGTCGCTSCSSGEDVEGHRRGDRAAAGPRQRRRAHLLRGRG